MKERQRWTVEEDNILRAYVKQFGPKEWHLVSQRMNVTLDRHSKSCLQRWKNYLKPGIKKGSLSEEEQRLVIRLQAKHGNKWKKIAAEIPGCTAKRLGKWWEVYKEKQQRALKQVSSKCLDPIEEGKYDRILENFAEKLVKERAPRGAASFLMTSAPPPAAPVLSGAASFFMTSASPAAPVLPGAAPFFMTSAPPAAPTLAMLPPWLAMPNGGGARQPSAPSSPSVTLSLASSTVAPAMQPSVSAVPWLHSESSGPAHNIDNGLHPLSLGCLPPCHGPVHEHTVMMAELIECCRELDEGNQALASHKKEAAWRLKRVELQLESEKLSRRREIMEEFEAKIRALREEEKASLERIEAEYREELACLRRDAEAKELKMVEQWSAKHLHLTKLVEQIGCYRVRTHDPN